LEGSIAITGALIQWLRDNLKPSKKPDIDLARTVEDNGGIYFVPAFSASSHRIGEASPRSDRRLNTLCQPRTHPRAALEATAA
jgi:glycerol kinase